jgi:hypothetical protein
MTALLLFFSMAAIPAESVYAVFKAKQTADAGLVA